MISKRKQCVVAILVALSVSMIGTREVKAMDMVPVNPPDLEEIFAEVNQMMEEFTTQSLSENAAVLDAPIIPLIDEPIVTEEPPVIVIPENATYAGIFRTTYYCCEKRRHICGTGSGITASGRPVTPYVSAAVDTSVIPLGSTVYIDFGDHIAVYSADDTGSAVNGAHIDLAVTTHQEALSQTTGKVAVYFVR